MQAFDDLFSGKFKLSIDGLNAYLHSIKAKPIIGTPAAEPFVSKVRASMRLGESLRVNGTPTFFHLKEDGTLTEVHLNSSIDSAVARG